MCFISSMALRVASAASPSAGLSTVLTVVCLSHFMSASRRRRGAAAGGKSEEAGAPRLTVVAVRDQMVAEIAQLRQENIEMAKAVTAAVFGHAQGAGAATAPGSGPVCRRRGGWAGGASPGAAVPAAGGTAASTDSETFANLLSQGRRRSGQATGEGARRWQADDDSLAKNPTWRPNFLIAKAQLRVGDSLCATRPSAAGASRLGPKLPRGLDLA